VQQLGQVSVHRIPAPLVFVKCELPYGVNRLSGVNRKQSFHELTALLSLLLTLPQRNAFLHRKK
jgi:hypothetical protein